jgi:hypothetical protein
VEFYHFGISVFEGLRSQEIDARVREIAKPVISYFFRERSWSYLGGRLEEKDLWIEFVYGFLNRSPKRYYRLSEGRTIL